MIGLVPGEGQVLREAENDRYRFTFNTTSDQGVDEYRVSVVNDTTGQATGYTVQEPVGITNALETYTVERLLALVPGQNYRWAVFAHDAQGTQLSRSDYRNFTIKSNAPVTPPRFSNVLQNGTAFTSVTVDSVDDPSYGPDLAIDGFIDTESTWSGDRDSVITFDVGSVQAVDGFYLYMNDLRNHWIKIETSQNGSTWVPEFGGITATSMSHSLSDFALSGAPVRYIRVTGFGSVVNQWTNIREAKWRSAGDPLAGERVRHVRSGSSTKGFTSMNADTRFDLFTEFVLEGLSLSYQCTSPRPFGGLADVTGDNDYSFRRDHVDRAHYFMVDWDNYNTRYTYELDNMIRSAQGYVYPRCTSVALSNWEARIPGINNQIAALKAQKRLENSVAP